MSTNSKLIDWIYAAIFAAATAALGFISIPLPFSPIPITCQNLVIMLAGSILTVRQAALSIITFLLLGAIGLPVFTGGTGGIGVIVGPRGGYLIGYLAGAVVIALIRGHHNNWSRLALANIIGGVLIVYTFGIAWLSFVTGIGIQAAITTGALPFIPGDLCKVFIATVTGAAVNSRLGKTQVRP